MVDLRLLRTAEQPAPLPSWPVVATTARPGELARELELWLSPPAADRVATEAASKGGASHNWARAAIEATRHLQVLLPLLRMEDAAAIEVLTEAAGREAHAMIPLAAAPLVVYAKALRTAANDRTQTSFMVKTPLRLAVSEELAGGWAGEAARNHQSLDEWASDLIVAAPEPALTWESAAAARSRYLGEWMALVLLSHRSSSASPQV